MNVTGSDCENGEDLDSRREGNVLLSMSSGITTGLTWHKCSCYFSTNSPGQVVVEAGVARRTTESDLRLPMEKK